MVRVAFLLLVSLVAVFPLYWQAIGSVTDNEGILHVPPRLLPIGYDLDNYAVLFSGRFAIGRWLWNSILVVAATVALQIGTSLPAAYAMELRPFRGARIVWAALLASMMLSGQLTLIPLYKLIRAMGMATNRLGLIVPFAVSPFAVFAMRAYLRDFPREVLDAAQIDGAGEARTIAGVVVPMCVPILAAMGSMTAVGMWNAYLWQSLIANTDRTRTLLLGVTRVVWDTVFYKQLRTEQDLIDYGVLMAGAMVVFAPMGLLFAFSARYTMKGLFAGREKV